MKASQRPEQSGLDEVVDRVVRQCLYLCDRQSSGRDIDRDAALFPDGKDRLDLGRVRVVNLSLFLWIRLPQVERRRCLLHPSVTDRQTDTHRSYIRDAGQCVHNCNWPIDAWHIACMLCLLYSYRLITRVGVKCLDTISYTRGQISFVRRPLIVYSLWWVS